MTTVPALITRSDHAVDAHAHRERIARLLLFGGIATPLWYAAMNVVGALQFQGYSTVSQTISELSAIGAPSRTVWVALGFGYTALVLALGVGMWRSAHGNSSLRAAGAMLAGYALIGLAWPPMHLRGQPTSLTDALHIAFTAVEIPLAMAVIVVAARAFEKRFRLYSYATIAVTIGFGALMAPAGARIPKGLPTPFIGVWERISAAAFMIWFAAIAVTLIRRSSTRR